MVNANSRYGQGDVNAEDGEETAFTPHHGLYCFFRIRFGLTMILRLSKPSRFSYLPQFNGHFGLVHLGRLLSP